MNLYEIFSFLNLREKWGPGRPKIRENWEVEELDSISAQKQRFLGFFAQLLKVGFSPHSYTARGTTYLLRYRPG